MLVKTKEALKKADEEWMRKIVESHNRAKVQREKLHQKQMNIEALKVQLEVAPKLRETHDRLAKYVACKKKVVAQLEILTNFIKQKQENLIVKGIEAESVQQIKGLLTLAFLASNIILKQSFN